MATKRPSANTGLRLPPFTRTELQSILDALGARGETVKKQDDLFAVLIARATAFVGDAKALDELGSEIRAHRVKAKAVGY
jgi:hypothetical protein